MGARFVGKPIDAVLKATAEWNDVISINSYPSNSERNGPPMSRIVAIYNATNKPILIGKFAYKANVRSTFSHHKTFSPCTDFTSG